MSFRALVISKTDTGQKVEITNFDEADLMEGNVTIDISHSSVNYKDGLALAQLAPGPLAGQIASAVSIFPDLARLMPQSIKG